MEKRINEIQKALANELYYCALSLALTLPDICGKHEYPNEKRTCRRYVNWFNKYAKSYFTCIAVLLPDEDPKEYIWFSAEECYALRCAYLHAGNYSLKNVDLGQVHLHAHVKDGQNYSHIIRNNYLADWDVIEICSNICCAVEEYCSNRKLCDIMTDEIRIDCW